MKDLISNCFLCGEKSLHVAGTEEAQVMQCINCGYTTSTKFKGIKADNEEFQKRTYLDSKYNHFTNWYVVSN